MQSSQVIRPSYKNKSLVADFRWRVRQALYGWREWMEEERNLLNTVNDDRAAKLIRVLTNSGYQRFFSIFSTHFRRAIWSLRFSTMQNGKRVFDITMSLLVLPFLLPVMALTALAIKLDSPGPILFRQPRVGKWGKVFECYKFRSMYQDAEQRKAELMAQNEADEVVFKMKRDPRVTPVGRIIRKLSIDELPQIFNVLEGNMSLVGPRPPVPYEVSLYSYDHMHRLDVTPGITGLQQVSGRSTLPFKQWVELDLQYIEQQSLRKDIEILIRTVPAVITGRGAY